METNDKKIIHLDEVNFIKQKMYKEELLIDVAELFKIFGDSTRIKIICALMNGELCVYDIANVINATQSATSHQLRILKTSKLVKVRKDGKESYYSLDDSHVIEIFKKGCEHVEEI